MELIEENLLNLYQEVIKMENKCPNCGKELKIVIDGSAKNFSCEYCGYSFATSITEGIEWDSKEYTIILEKDNIANLIHVKTISKLSSYNFIESKNLLLNGGILNKGRAIYIKEIIQKLKNLDIKFRVTPELIYN